MDPAVIIFDGEEQHVVKTETWEGADYIARKATGRHPNQRIDGEVDGHKNAAYLGKEVQAYIIDDSQLTDLP